MAGIHDKFRKDKHRKPTYALKSKLFRYHGKLCTKCKKRRKSRYHHYLCNQCWKEKENKWFNNVK